MAITNDSPRPAPPTPGVHRPAVEIVVPVYNEEGTLERSVRRLRTFLRSNMPFDRRIVSPTTRASTKRCDRSAARPSAAGRRGPPPRARKGRGREPPEGVDHSDSDVACYMDVDLSTGLNAVLPLVAPLVSGHSDVAIGTRLARGSRVVRARKRELIRGPTTDCSAWHSRRAFPTRSAGSRRCGRMSHDSCCRMSVIRAGSLTPNC